MSTWQRKLRRAIGSVKDQTTIGLAKVAGAIAPELEVALVKATSHDKSPVEEKQVRHVLFLSSTSRAYAMACVTHLSRRLSRTQNWIVAVKTLMLIHRLLREGDRFFQGEFFRESRAGSHILNLSGFQDDSVSCGWEYSAFVRTYALYLDELLDYNASSFAGIISTDSGRLSSSSNSSYGRRSGSDAYGYVNEDQGHGLLNVAFKDMKPPELLEKIPPVQRMLERVLACHPAGAAGMDRLIQNALDCIVWDSFQYYGIVSDGLAILLDAFFEMEGADCTRAFEIQTMAAKQAEALIAFYGFCKSILGCQSSEYPFVQRIPEELLETMEGFLRDLVMKAGTKQSGTLLALPAPPVGEVILASTQSLDMGKKSMEPSFLVMNDHGAIASKDQVKAFDVPPLAPTSNLPWRTFDSGEQLQLSPRQMGEGKLVNGWELSLHTSSSDHMPLLLSRFAPGKDSHVDYLGRVKEQASNQQRLPLSLSIGSLTTAQTQPPSLLALPAPNTPPEEDSFVASSSIPPPSYVQMSDMKQKQALLLQEQMLWSQLQRKGIQGKNGLAAAYNGRLDGVYQPFPSVPFLNGQ